MLLFCLPAPHSLQGQQAHTTATGLPRGQRPRLHDHQRRSRGAQLHGHLHHPPLCHQVQADRQPALHQRDHPESPCPTPKEIPRGGRGWGG